MEPMFCLSTIDHTTKEHFRFLVSEDSDVTTIEIDGRSFKVDTDGLRNFVVTENGDVLFSGTYHSVYDVSCEVIALYSGSFRIENKNFFKGMAQMIKKVLA